MMELNKFVSMKLLSPHPIGMQEISRVIFCDACGCDGSRCYDVATTNDDVLGEVVW